MHWALKVFGYAPPDRSPHDQIDSLVVKLDLQADTGDDVCRRAKQVAERVDVIESMRRLTRNGQ